MDALGCAMRRSASRPAPNCWARSCPASACPTARGCPAPLTYSTRSQAAFDIGAMIRWLDYNDTWLAAEWGHPSDNLGGILATADLWPRNRSRKGDAADHGRVLHRHDQGPRDPGRPGPGEQLQPGRAGPCGPGQGGYCRRGDPACWAAPGQVINALSHAWIDGQALRTYRHAPNTGSRKSWAAGDATSRACAWP